jgi:DNA repair exonuclease SbcCD ATPase subunit
MRPINLEMTAFGSYAQKTVVPFNELKHGLYLVTGDTGAGKTTIFDAIMFALYGVASGTERSSDMMHCDHVPKSVDTEVKLLFEQNGREYTVTRKIHFTKTRGTDNQYGDGKIDALLEFADHAPIEGATKVTDRCTELLGLNAEQFRKIVMLAQGEFREFLKADSNKKNEILGKLFDNSSYVYYQSLLGAARDKLKTQRTDKINDLNTLMHNSFQLPENHSLDDVILYDPNNPELLENLQKLIEAEKAKNIELLQTCEETQRLVNSLNIQKGAAEATNKQLNDLEAAKARFEILTQQAHDMETRQEKYERAKSAVYDVKPKIEQFEKAEKALTTTEQEIAELKEKAEQQEKALSEAQIKVDGDEENNNQLLTIRDKIQSIKTQLPLFEQLKSKQADKETAEKAVVKAATEKAELEEAKAEAESNVAALKEAISKLENIEVDVTRLEAERSKTEESKGEFSGICTQVGIIKGIEENLIDQQDELIAVTKAAQTAMTAYNDLYQHFIAGQAGILAGSLKREIDEHGHGICPVCGTEFTDSNDFTFEQVHEDLPTQDEVDAANEKHDKAEKARAAQDKKVESLKTNIHNKKESAVKMAEKFLPQCGDWNTLSDDDFLLDTQKLLEEKAKQIDADYSEAKEKQTAKQEYKKSLESTESKLQKLLGDIDSCRAAENQQNTVIQTLTATISEIQKQLSFESEEDASQRKASLEAEQKDLTESVEANKKALDTAKSQLNITQGSLSEKQNSIAKLEQDKDTAKAAMDVALTTGDFDSVKAVEQALLPIKGTDSRLWLKNEEQALSDYTNDCNNTKEKIDDLAKQLEGKVHIDMDELNQQLEQADIEQKAANEALNTQSNLVSNHSDVLEKAQKAREYLNSTESAWRRIQRLGDLAEGVTGEGGKLSFDRYVMGTVFREILEMANRRMDLMSGGKYQLIHKSSADRKNAKAGLDIEVLDISTGQQRPSGSLSGGEAFFTSLSLALGLSDVVQNHAGGKKLDTLFIDEGFGSLSDDVLDKALDVLNQLTEGNRLVGIISHVDKLGESIPQKIRVKNTDKGSTLSLELA